MVKELAILGYVLTQCVTDNLGNKWLYRTSPNNGGGPINYFNSKKEIEDYILEVKFIRSIQ
jgi:hypothetical protein